VAEWAAALGPHRTFSDDNNTPSLVLVRPRSAFRYLLPPSTAGREPVTMLVVFVVLALGMSLMLLRHGR
jgi:hypothetical protein